MILHADADAFFVSVALREHPELRGSPVVVAGPVVCAASYEARAHDVTSGMPLRHAVRRYPDLVVLDVRDYDFESASAELFALFRRFASTIEPGSMEEAFLDIGAADPYATAHALREAAWNELGLPVSVGVARTKLLAKLSSRRAKPDGAVVLLPAEETAVRDGLRVEQLWGVGPPTAAALAEQGVTTLAQLRDLTADQLQPVVGTMMANRLLAMAQGREDDVVRPPRPPSSVSASRTLSAPTRSATRVRTLLAELVKVASSRAEATGRPPRSVQVVVRFDDGGHASARVRLDGSSPAVAALAALRSTSYDEDGRGVANVSVGFGLAPPPRPDTGVEQLALPLG